MIRQRHQIVVAQVSTKKHITIYNSMHQVFLSLIIGEVLERGKRQWLSICIQHQLTIFEALLGVQFQKEDF